MTSVQSIWNELNKREASAEIPVDEKQAALEWVAREAGSERSWADWCFRAMRDSSDFDRMLPLMWREHSGMRARARDGSLVLLLPRDSGVLVLDGGVWRVVPSTGGQYVADDEEARALARLSLIELHGRAHALQSLPETACARRAVGMRLGAQYAEARAIAEERLGGLRLDHLASLRPRLGDCAWWQAQLAD